MVLLFRENIVFTENELVLSISYDDIIKFVDAFYAVKMEWEDYIILTTKADKAKISLNKLSKLNRIIVKNGCIFIYLSENNIDYIIASLMQFYHFKTMPVNHIHLYGMIENIDGYQIKSPKSFDFTVFLLS